MHNPILYTTFEWGQLATNYGIHRQIIYNYVFAYQLSSACIVGEITRGKSSIVGQYRVPAMVWGGWISTASDNHVVEGQHSNETHERDSESLHSQFRYELILKWARRLLLCLKQIRIFYPQWINHRPFEQQHSMEGNITQSILSFTPTVEDKGKYLSCRAEHTSIPESGTEDGWKLGIRRK